MGYGPWGRKESDTTEHTAHTHGELVTPGSYPFSKDLDPSERATSHSNLGDSNLELAFF